MHKFLFIILFNGILVPSVAVAQSAAINSDGSNADASAMLDVKSTNKGMLVPRMTTVQRTTIASPAKGLLVFDNDTGDFWFYNGAAWVSLTSGESINVWKKNADTIYSTNKGNVGIGISDTLIAKLHVRDTLWGLKTHFLADAGVNKPGLSIFTSKLNNTGDPFPVESEVGIGFNSYAKVINNLYNYRNISDGFSGFLEYDTQDGILKYNTSSDSRLANDYIVANNSFQINKYGHVAIFSGNVTGLYNFEVRGTSKLDFAHVAGKVGIGIEPTTYALDVDGGSSRFRTATRFDETVNPNNTLVVGQDLLVNVNKGIVRSNNSTQLKIVRGQLSFTVANLPVGTYLETGFIDYENFGGTPQVFVGNVLSFTTQDWTKLLITPFEASSSGCKFRIFNAGTSAASGSFVYQYMAMGPQ